MTSHNIANLVLGTGEEDHFLKMLNVCILDRPWDPVEREEAVWPFLEDLAESLQSEIRPEMDLSDLKGLISDWIDRKISEARATQEAGQSIAKIPDTKKEQEETEHKSKIE